MKCKKVFKTYVMPVLLAGSLFANTVAAEELLLEEAAVAVAVTEDAQEVTVAEDANIQMQEAASEDVEEQILDMAEDYEEEDLDDVLSMLALAEEEEAAVSGQCGDNMYWYLEQGDGDPCIRIEGSGKMWDYSPSERPGWEKHPARIVNLEGQITSIGAYAFYKEESLELITIGDCLESVGDYAFADCQNLWHTDWSENLKTIGDSAYENCDIVVEQYYNENLTSIGARAFAGNSGFRRIVLKGKDTTIGKDAFAGCASDFIIYCDADSKAAEYAEANGIEHASEKVQIASCTPSLSESSFIYDGEAKEPVVTVTYGDKTLEENKDFAYECLNNVNAGTASVNIYGMGRYEGVTTVSFTIEKAPSVITASDKNATVNVSASQKLSIGAKLDRSGTLSYSSNKKSVTVDKSGKVTIAKGFSGTAQITISAAATKNYEAAKKVIKVVVKKENNVIKAYGKTLYGNPTKAQTFTIKPTAKGNVKFYYSSDNANITVNKYGKVTVKKNYIGTANITIKTSATKRYYRAEKVIKVIVNKKDNTITAKDITVATNPAAAKTVSINAKAGGAKLTYSSDNSNITVSSTGKLTIKKGYVGSATITIKSASTKVYNAATKKITVTVTRAANTITASNKSVLVNMLQNTTITLGAKAKGDAALTYKSDNEKVTVNTKGVVTVAKGFSGTANITISSAQTRVYKAATKTIKITVNKRENVIQASGYTMKASNNSQTYNINATAKGGAGLTYKSDNSSVTVNSAGTVTVKGGFTGNATITIVSAATSEYKETTKKIVIKVEKQKQLLTFKPTKYLKSAASIAVKEDSFEIIPLQHQGEISLKSKTPAYIQVFKVKDKVDGKIHHIVKVLKGTPAGTYKVEVKAAESGIYAEEVREFEITLS